MVEAALYILTGLTLYGGTHHIVTGIKQTNAQYHWPIGGLYLLLAAFALSSALTHQAANLNALLPTGKLAISLGIVLWASLVWLIAVRTGYKPLLLLDSLTAVWLIFLLQNLFSPNSLLYADVTPIQQTTISGETIGLLFTQISPWWTAVELTMLASLVFCFYACYHLYRQKPQPQAIIYTIGLTLLGMVTLFDHFVSSQLIQAGYLAPLGFLLFLLICSLSPLLQRSLEKLLPEHAPIYNLTYMPDQASFHNDVSQLHAPGTVNHGQRAAGSESDEVQTTATVPADSNLQAETTVDNSEAELIDNTIATGKTKITASEEQNTNKEKSSHGNVQTHTACDTETLHSISDNLIDIAVYATMALNRFKRGEADPQSLVALCKKVRSQAVKTRRLATQLLHTDRNNDKP